MIAGTICAAAARSRLSLLLFSRHVIVIVHFFLFLLLAVPSSSSSPCFSVPALSSFSSNRLPNLQPDQSLLHDSDDEPPVPIEESTLH